MTKVALATHFIVLTLAGLLLGDAREWSWDFEKYAVGEQPPEFCFDNSREDAPGKWAIADDEGNHVLAQLDENPARRRYTMAIVKDQPAKHVDMSVRIKAIRGERDQSGGLVWRYKDADTYLVARLDVTEKNVRLFRFWDGNRVQIGVKEDLNLETGNWYTLRVEHRGKEIKVYLDGDIMLIEHDKHFPRPGRFGLWTKAHSVMYFDDFAAKNIGDD
jgi:hypothetical protein